MCAQRTLGNSLARARNGHWQLPCTGTNRGGWAWSGIREVAICAPPETRGCDLHPARQHATSSGGAKDRVKIASSGVSERFSAWSSGLREGRVKRICLAGGARLVAAHTRTHAHMHAYARVHTHGHTHTHTHTGAAAGEGGHTRMHTHACTHTRAHRRSTQAYTHTHDIYEHILPLRRSSW